MGCQYVNGPTSHGKSFIYSLYLSHDHDYMLSNLIAYFPQVQPFPTNHLDGARASATGSRSQNVSSVRVPYPNQRFHRFLSLSLSHTQLSHQERAIKVQSSGTGTPLSWPAGILPATSAWLSSAPDAREGISKPSSLAKEMMLDPPGSGESPNVEPCQQAEKMFRDGSKSSYPP